MAIKKKPLLPSEALKKLRELCDRGEYCSSEIMERARRWGIKGADAGRILSILISERYVDDTRYANAVVHSKITYSHWGRMKVRLYLSGKRIAANVISEALENIDEEEYQSNLLSVISSKKRSLGEEADTYEGRTKIFRYAVSKGYEPSMVATALRSGQF